MENEKMFEFIEKIYIEMQSIKIDMQSMKIDMQSMNDEMQLGFKTVNERLDNVETKDDSNHIEVIERLDKLDLLVEDLDPKNATRHIDIINKINELSKDLAVVEVVTGKNMSDIAGLKLVK